MRASGMRVFVHGAAATPTPLIEALARRTDPRAAVDAITCTPPARRRLPSPSMPGASAPSRSSPARRCASAIDEGRADFVPVFLSDIPRAVHVAGDPARRGAACSCRRPIATATARSAPRSTRRSPPRTRRASSSPRSTSGCRARTATRSSRFDRVSTPSSAPTGRCTTHQPAPPSAGRGRDRRARGQRWWRTARRCRWASARSPTRCCGGCADKHDLGVHTEMFSDGVVDLVEAGVDHQPAASTSIRGRIVTSFVDRHRSGSTTSSTTTRSSSSTPAIAPTTPRSSARTTRSSRSTRRSRSICPGRCAPTRSASASTPASAARWTSSAARRCRRAASRSSRCRRRPPGGTAVAHRRGAQARRRRRHHARPRPLGGDRVRRRQPVRTLPLRQRGRRR